VMSADEVSPAVWSLKLCSDPLCENEISSLMARVPGPQNAWRRVVFKDYGVAIRVEHWLQTHPTSKLRDASLEFNYPGDGTYGTIAPVKTNGDDCKREPLEQSGNR
jgi:hypothetical protein